MPFEKFDL